MRSYSIRVYLILALVCSGLFSGILGATKNEATLGVDLDEETNSLEGIFQSVLTWGEKEKVIDASQRQKLHAELEARLERYHENPG